MSSELLKVVGIHPPVPQIAPLTHTLYIYIWEIHRKIYFSGLRWATAFISCRFQDLIWMQHCAKYELATLHGCWDTPSCPPPKMYPLPVRGPYPIKNRHVHRSGLTLSMELLFCQFQFLIFMQRCAKYEP
jgi:hypothetical protein